MILLTTDWHLDDNSSNDYRWNIFDRIIDVIGGFDVSSIFVLGDLVDRRDRHSSRFVNRLVYEFRRLGQTRHSITILRGNHETLYDNSAYWEFLNEFRLPIRYITKPTSQNDLILLPFTPSPADDWAFIPFDDYEAAFMHATVEGAKGENGYELSGGKFPKFPKHLKIYSGDVHVPQRVGQVVYVGCPHPIKFGDGFPCRMLLLDEKTFEVVEEIPIETKRKCVVEISSVDDLKCVEVAQGDQVRIKVSIASEDVARWGEVEAAIGAWAKRHKVDVSAVEAELVGSNPTQVAALDAAPEDTLRQFAAGEKMDDALLQMGLGILKEAQA